MFLRLCGPPSIPLSFTGPEGRKAGIHRLPCGLPGYLILFDTRTFEPQRQLRSRQLPSQSEFFVISKHFTATRQIPLTLRALKQTSSRCSAEVGPLHFTTRLTCGLRSL